VIFGSPATVSIVIQGCSAGGTCDTLDTYTNVAASIRGQRISGVYAYFVVTASWSGGTNVSVGVGASESYGSCS
jgi:hypothetical protein